MLLGTHLRGQGKPGEAKLVYVLSGEAQDSNKMLTKARLVLQTENVQDFYVAGEIEVCTGTWIPLDPIKKCCGSFSCHAGRSEQLVMNPVRPGCTVW